MPPSTAPVHPFSRWHAVLALVLAELAAVPVGVAAETAPAAPTPAEQALRKILGANTPAPIRLWAGAPPLFLPDAPPETVDENARIRMISVPTISLYLPPPDRATGMALIVCPGGGYGTMDWRTHVVFAAEAFNPMGVAIIGLKYRTRPPHALDHAGIQALALRDVQRAVRLVRHHADEWKLDPRRIGVAGYSAGANLAMNLACRFDAGDPAAPDPIDRRSCRPDFVVGLATWHWRQKESPFAFPKDAPPVFMVHATNDTIDLPRAIKADLEKLGVPVRLAEFEEGGHGVGNLIPQRVRNNFPPARWPQLLLQWLKETPIMKQSASTGRGTSAEGFRLRGPATESSQLQCP